jgi:hypothetical protein
MNFAVSAELSFTVPAVLRKRYVKEFVTGSLVMIPIGTAFATELGTIQERCPTNKSL